VVRGYSRLVNRGNFTFASCTDIGVKHSVNQDCSRFVASIPCFVLADGVGGHQGGEIASQFVVEKLIQGQQQLSSGDIHLSTLKEQLKRLLIETNQQLITLGASKGIDMGTTVVSAIVLGGQLHYMHVGDSRLYLLRNNLLVQLTKDDTLKQQVIDAELASGVKTNAQVPSNIVTQALGLTAKIEIHYGQLALRGSDILLCSSDGLHDVVVQQAIEQQMAVKKNLQHCAQKLVDTALENGSQDNISVLLMEYSLPLLGSLIQQVKKRFT